MPRSRRLLVVGDCCTSRLAMATAFRAALTAFAGRRRTDIVLATRFHVFAESLVYRRASSDRTKACAPSPSFASASAAYEVAVAYRVMADARRSSSPSVYA